MIHGLIVATCTPWRKQQTKQGSTFNSSPLSLSLFLQRQVATLPPLKLSDRHLGTSIPESGAGVGSARILPSGSSPQYDDRSLANSDFQGMQACMFRSIRDPFDGRLFLDLDRLLSLQVPAHSPCSPLRRRHESDMNGMLLSYNLTAMKIATCKSFLQRSAVGGSSLTLV